MESCLKENLQYQLSIENFIKNPLLASLISQSGTVSFKSLQQILGCNPSFKDLDLTALRNILEEKFIVDEVKGNIIIANPLWIALPLEIKINGSSYSEFFELEELIINSKFRHDVTEREFSPTESAVLLKLKLHDDIEAKASKLLAFLESFEKFKSKRIEVIRLPLKSLLLRNQISLGKMCENPHQGLVSNKRMRLASFDSNEKLTFECIVQYFRRNQGFIEINNSLENIDEDICPILNKKANIKLECLEPTILPRRKFSAVSNENSPHFDIEMSKNCRRGFGRRGLLEGRSLRKGSYQF